MMKNKKSFKKIRFVFFAIFLSFSLFLNVLANKPQYDPSTGKVKYIAVSVKAQTNIKFKSLGWYPYIEINGRTYDAKDAIVQVVGDDILADEYYKETGEVLKSDEVATKFLMPLTGEDSMLEVLKHAYAYKNEYDREVFDDMENVFFQGKDIFLNAVVAVNDHGKILGKYTEESFIWNPGEDSAEFSKDESKSKTYTIYIPDDRFALTKYDAMYNMKTKSGDPVHWRDPEKTFEDYYDVRVAIEKMPVNKYYFIDYVKVKSDGTYERIQNLGVKGVSDSNKVEVNADVETVLTADVKEIEGLKLIKTAVIQTGTPTRYLDDTIYGESSYILDESSYEGEADKVTGVFKAINDVTEWKDPHLVLYYTDEAAKTINVKHFEKDMDDGSTSLLGETNVPLKKDEPTTVESLGGKKLLETKFGPDVSLMVSSEDGSVQVTADKFILGDT